MRLSVCIAAILLALPGPAQQPPVFRAGVGLVTVDVRVLDSDGRPVTGLTEDDFVVELAGKTQPVRVVEYVVYPGAGVPELVDAPEAPVPGRPPSKPNLVGGRAVLLAFDDMSMRPGQTQTFVAAARRLISTLGGSDTVQVATTGTQGARSGMSRDKTRALLALNDITGKRSDPTQDGSGQRVGGAGPAAANEIVLSSAEALAIQSGNGSVFSEVTQRVCGRALQLTAAASAACGIAVKGEATQQAIGLERTLNFQFDSLMRMIETLRLEAAPRILILLSAGVDTEANRATQIDTLRSTAIDAGVQVHVMTNVLGTSTETSDRTVVRSRIRRENDDYSRRGLEFVASKLDADLYKAVGGSDRGVDRVMLGWSGSYRVAVDQPASITRAGAVPVAITVRRPGATVRAPKVIMVRPARGSTSTAAALDSSVPAAPPSSAATLARLVDDGGAATDVPMAVGALSKRDDTGRDVQVVTVEVPAAVGGPLSGLFAATDESNRLIARGTLAFGQRAEGDDYRVSVVVPLVPGAYRLRVAVADGAGAVGSVEHAATSRLSRLRSSSVSDLLVSWVGDDGQAHMVAMEALPEAARKLQASLEFYSTADSAGTTVIMAILKEGATSPVAEAQAAPIKTATGWRLGVGVPLASLDPGAYVVRATVKEGTDPPLVLTRTVRKAGVRRP